MREDAQQYLFQKHRIINVKRLASGGMGEIYKGKDMSLSRDVAIKVFSGNAHMWFLDEQQHLAGLRHPAIVTLYASGTLPSGQLYYIMDYVPGTTLRQIISARKQTNKPFTVTEIRDLLMPIAAALDYIHSRTPKIIHRDIKPENILVPTNTVYEVKSLLTDFGISLSTNTHNRAALLTAMTEAYAPPEFYNSSYKYVNVDDHIYADNYALAAIAFEMLLLRKLKNAVPETQWKSIRSIPRSYSDHLGATREVFAKALNQFCNNRYDSAVEFLADLARASQPQPVIIIQPTHSHATNQTARWVRWVVAAALVLFFVYWYAAQW